MCLSDFHDVLARASQGDNDALGQLAAHIEPRLREAVHKRLAPWLRSALETMDVVQAVHKSLLVGIRDHRFTFASEEDVYALAFVMIRRKLARHAQQAQKRQEVLDLHRLVAGHRPSDDPARAVDDADQLQVLLGRLNNLRRRLLTLHLQGLSTAAIGEELGMTPENVRVERSRALAQLREGGLHMQ